MPKLRHKKRKKGTLKYIRQIANDGFDCGHTYDPDDFDAFKKDLNCDGYYYIHRSDFGYYFSCLDDARERYYDRY